jgi:hypothetical protein
MNSSIMAYHKNTLACGAYCAEQMEVSSQTAPALQRTRLGKNSLSPAQYLRLQHQAEFREDSWKVRLIGL